MRPAQVQSRHVRFDGWRLLTGWQAAAACRSTSISSGRNGKASTWLCVPWPFRSSSLLRRTMATSRILAHYVVR